MFFLYTSFVALNNIWGEQRLCLSAEPDQYSAFEQYAKRTVSSPKYNVGTLRINTYKSRGDKLNLLNLHCQINIEKNSGWKKFSATLFCLHNVMGTSNDEARSEFTTALKLDPQFHQAHYKLLRADDEQIKRPEEHSGLEA